MSSGAELANLRRRHITSVMRWMRQESGSSAAEDLDARTHRGDVMRDDNRMLRSHTGTHAADFGRRRTDSGPTGTLDFGPWAPKAIEPPARGDPGGKTMWRPLR